MHLVEVTDKRTARQFLDVARVLYKNDPIWICPLDQDINKIFDPVRNTFFKEGNAIRWILRDDKGRLIGRIGAFYNKKKAFLYKQPTGGAGFFECINDQEAASMLFDAAMNWLNAQGLEAMDAPVNFGENDNFWGLLVEGFTKPAYGMPYNFAYYQSLFETFGFKPYFTQITKHLDLTVPPVPERLMKIAEWVNKRGGYSFRHFDYKETDKFIHDLKEVYDQAWAMHEHFTPLDVAVVKREMEGAKPILQEDFIWFVYKDDKPVAFYIMFPDINMILRHFNGKMHLWNKLRFLYYKKTGEITRIRQTMMGVVPKYQGQGLESAIFWHLREPLLKRPHINEMELSWVGDFNPKMMAIQEAVNAKPGKIHITYRRLFKDESDMQRASRIPLKRIKSADVYNR